MPKNVTKIKGLDSGSRGLGTNLAGVIVLCNWAGLPAMLLQCCLHVGA